MVNIKRKIVEALGGTLYSDIPITNEVVYHHSLIKYTELRSTCLVDTLNPEMPLEVYEDALARQMMTELKKVMTGTNEHYPYRPATKIYTAKLWVGTKDE